MKRTLIFLLAAMLALPVSARTFKGRILKLDFRLPVEERGGSSMEVGLSGLSRKSAVSLFDLERALEKAAKDPGIALVFMTPDRLEAGQATTEEIRASLARFRESGKPVISYSTDFDSRSYYLASVADMVIMNPAGEGDLTGLSNTLFFLKDALDTLGIRMQLIRHGKYKSAGEMYTRNDISPENREQYETMLRSAWANRMEDIAASRGVDAGVLDSLVRHLSLNTAQSWVDNGLVDELGHRDEVEGYLAGLFQKAAKDLDYVTLEDYAEKLKDGSGDKIAVVFADGSISRDGSDGIVGEKMARTLAGIREDKHIKAVVFRVNSPGGEVVASDLIRREVDLLRKEGKPVIASYGDYAASGGYWISSSADRIFCSRSTLTGSIGVFGLIPVFGDALKKHLKINTVTLKTHPHSDAGRGFRMLDEEETEAYQKSIERVYDRFVSLVAESRGKTREEIDAIAQGRVWAGRDAMGIGLVDEFGTLMDAIRYAAGMAGLKNWQTVSYPIRKKGLKALIGDDDPAPLVRLPEVMAPLAEYGTAPQILARLPYDAIIR
jgi:protease-4